MRRRRGFLLLELIVGAILLGTILSVTLRFVVALGASQRAIGYREAAMREAANAMEKLWTMDWEKLSDERGADLLSEEARGTIPGLAIQLHVDAPAEQPEAKRVRVEVQWNEKAVEPNNSVRLVAWRYRMPQRGEGKKP